MGRGAGWCALQNKQVCRSWLTVSQDAITSNEQDRSDFQSKLTEHYNAEIMKTSSSSKKKPQYEERKSTAVIQRWREISKCVIVFNGIVQEIWNLNESGKTDEDKMEDAERAYVADRGEPFMYMNCWSLLKEAPKWKSYMTAFKEDQKRRDQMKRKKTMKKQDREEETDENQNPDVFSSEADVSVVPEKESRSIGSKKAKYEVALKHLQEREVRAKEAMAAQNIKRNQLVEEANTLKLFQMLPENDQRKEEYINLMCTLKLKQLRSAAQVNDEQEVPFDENVTDMLNTD